MTLSPGVSFAHSNVDGDFTNFTAFGSLADFKNQAFPRAPELTANCDTQYDWKLGDELGAFVGANVNYQDGTRSFFVDEKSTTVSPDPPGHPAPNPRGSPGGGHSRRLDAAGLGAEHHQ